MHGVYFPRVDFGLDNDSRFRPILDKVGISEKEYNDNLEPFLDSLIGSYFVEGPLLTNRFGFPVFSFGLAELSLSEIRGYLLEETDSLKIPIQDTKSMGFENYSNFGCFRLPNEERWRYHFGMVTKKYKKQIGTLTVRENGSGNEERFVELGKVEKKSIILPTMRLSEEALRRAFP